MIRMVLNAVKIANRITTARTMSPAMGFLSVDHCGRAADLDHVHLLTRVDHAVLVERARGPDLTLEAHDADRLVVGHALQDDRGLAHERGRPRTQERAAAHVAAG